jgi:hypothetical protein
MRSNGARIVLTCVLVITVFAALQLARTARRYEVTFSPVKGVVVDELGVPIADAVVVATLRSTTFGWGMSVDCPYQLFTRTDNRGNYLIPSAAQHAELTTLTVNRIIGIDVQLDWYIGTYKSGYYYPGGLARIQTIADSWNDGNIATGLRQTADGITYDAIPMKIASGETADAVVSAGQLLAGSRCRDPASPLMKNLRAQMIEDVTELVCSSAPGTSMTSEATVAFRALVKTKKKGKLTVNTPEAIRDEVITADMLCRDSREASER